MPQLDDNLLREVGLGDLPDDEKTKALDSINEALEERVGERLVSQLDDAQLAEFEEFIKQDDPNGAYKWVKDKAPGYEQLVSEELEKIKNQVRSGGLAALSTSA
jgi:5'-deoxynucleotidase YfbR-like HD superfamily hydrolase